MYLDYNTFWEMENKNRKRNSNVKKERYLVYVEYEEGIQRKEDEYDEQEIRSCCRKIC